MPLPSTTYNTIQQLLNDINARFVPNGNQEITGDIGNSQLNGLANFIVTYTLNSGLAGISSSTGVIPLSKPVTLFTEVPTSINWPDNVQNEYYIINATGSVIPLTSGYSYIDHHQVVQTSIPARSSIHIAKATNGSWILINNLSGSGGGGVTSVGLTMPFGFAVSNSPVTGDGTIVVTAANEWVSVTDYGAVGNGITDDTVNIQTALNSGAKTILFPQGIYNITAQLKVKSNTTIIGYGATILRGAAIDNMMINDSDGSIGLYGANENIQLIGLTFDGNRNNFPTNSTLVAFGHMTHVVVKDCEFRFVPGTWHGLELNAVQDGQVEGCYFRDGQGARGSSELLQLDLAGSSSLFPWFGPYDITSCKNIIITGNLFVGIGGGLGVGVGSHSSWGGGIPHTDVVISNNTFRNVHTAVGFTFYKNLVIDSNVIDGYVTAFYNSFNTGVDADWTISNNHFSNGIAGAGADGIAIQTSFVNGVVISGNNSNNSLSSGIIVNTCTGFTVVGNVIKNAGQDVVDTATIDIIASSNGYIANNIALKDPAVGIITSTNSIRATGANINVTIENNTCTTIAATTTFNLAGTGLIIGINTINGTITPAISTKTINYTYLPTDSVLNVDTTTGNVIITINPAIFNKQGLTIRKTTSDVNTVTITPSSGTINGLSSLTLTVLDHLAEIKSDWVNLSAIVLFNM